MNCDFDAGNSVPVAVMVTITVVITVTVAVMSGAPLPVFLLLLLVASVVTLVPVMVLIFPLNVEAGFGRPLAILVIVRVVDPPVNCTASEHNWR